MTRTAILYARVSTDEQATSGYSLRQQIEALRAWCGREGYEVLEPVEDPGYSGAYLERPGLDRVRDLVAAGGVSAVIAQDRDRFAREPAYVFLLKKEFEEHGTKIRALNDRGDDSPEGQLTDGILDQLAKFERAKTAERTRRGKLRKVSEGRLIRGPRAPYGFCYADDGDALAVNESEMRIVRQIFHAVGAEGLTLGEVVRRLERQGIPAPARGEVVAKALPQAPAPERSLPAPRGRGGCRAGLPGGRPRPRPRAALRTVGLGPEAAGGVARAHRGRQVQEALQGRTSPARGVTPGPRATVGLGTVP